MDGGKAVVIGLLGAVGSGKSTVARALGRLGARVVDADRLAAEALETDEVRRELREAFGGEVFGPDGRVDRSRLARAAFGGGDEGVERLNAAVHPPVLRRVLAELGRVRPGEILVLDLPLLYEKGLHTRCDLLVFVDTPEEECRGRLASRGLEAAEARRRQRHQAPLQEKQQAANFCLKNHKSLDALAKDVKILWEKRVIPLLSSSSSFS
jgi:dephospho-CoA kinase